MVELHSLILIDLAVEADSTMTTLYVEWDAVLSRLRLPARGRTLVSSPFLYSTNAKKHDPLDRVRLIIWWSQGGSNP